MFDLSWLPWIYVNIAPDMRRRLDLAGTRDASVAAREWPGVSARSLSWLPLRVAVPPARGAVLFRMACASAGRPMVGWAEIRGRYARVDGRGLNLSGWYDEAYGPEGAVTNFRGS